MDNNSQEFEFKFFPSNSPKPEDYSPIEIPILFEEYRYDFFQMIETVS